MAAEASLHAVLVKPLANEDVDESNGGVRDVDRDLLRSWDRIWQLGDLEDIGRAKARDDCCSHAQLVLGRG
jgi:hypothetical protein